MSRYGRVLVLVGWLLLLPVPTLVFWWAGWIHISRAHGALVEHGVLHDTTGPGVWTALAVVYLVWIVGLTVGTIWLFDRLGFHYQAYDRPARPTRRERRRRRAGMKYLQAREQANRDALREIAAESRKAARKTDTHGRAAAGGASHRGGVSERSGASKPSGASERSGASSGTTNGAADHTNGPAHDAADDNGAGGATGNERR